MLVVLSSFAMSFWWWWHIQVEYYYAKQTNYNNNANRRQTLPDLGRRCSKPFDIWLAICRQHHRPCFSSWLIRPQTFAFVRIHVEIHNQSNFGGLEANIWFDKHRFHWLCVVQLLTMLQKLNLHHSHLFGLLFEIHVSNQKHKHTIAAHANGFCCPFWAQAQITIQLNTTNHDKWAAIVSLLCPRR